MTPRLPPPDVHHIDLGGNAGNSSVVGLGGGRAHGVAPSGPSATEEDYEPEDEENSLLLARVEAGEAYHAIRRQQSRLAPPGRGGEGATSTVVASSASADSASDAFDHMPVPHAWFHVRSPRGHCMNRRSSSSQFSVQRMATRRSRTPTSFFGTPQTSSARGIGRYKRSPKTSSSGKLGAWGVNIPFEAVSAVKGVGDRGRLLALAFFNRAALADLISPD